MKKKILSLLLIMVMVLCAAACGNNNAANKGNNAAAGDNKGSESSSNNKNDNKNDDKQTEPQKVELTLWADQAAHAMYEEMIAEFKKAHPEYDLTVTLGDQSAQNLAEKLLADITAGGDIFESRQTS